MPNRVNFTICDTGVSGTNLFSTDITITLIALPLVLSLIGEQRGRFGHER